MSSTPRPTPIFGLLSVGLMVVCWVMMILMMTTPLMGMFTLFDLFNLTVIIAYVGGIVLATIALIRHERALWAVTTFITLVVSPIILMGTAIWMWSQV